MSLISILSLVGTLSSCIDNKESEEFKIISNCVHSLCHIELMEVDVQEETDLLGHVSKKILRETPLNDNSSLTWNIISSGSYADNTTMITHNLPPCQNDTCTDTSNPTGYIFPTETSTYNINVQGTVTLNDGSTKEINETSSITTETINTQVTFSYEDLDLSSTTASGTHDSTGIAWTTDQVHSISFTCPSGYGIPPNYTPPTYGGISDYISTEETSPSLLIFLNLKYEVRGGNPPPIGELWSSVEHYQNTPLEFTCVPDAHLYSYIKN